MPKLVETNLTDNAVRTAKSRSTRYDLYDANVRGLGLRVSLAGTKSWFAMRRVRGQMTRRTFGRYPETSLSEARILGAKTLASMASGESEANAMGHTVEVVVEEWLHRDQGNKRTVDQVRNAMLHDVLPMLAKRKLKDLRKADVNRVIDKIVDRGKGVQANRVLSYLRRFFNWCIERDYLTGNPTTGIPKPCSEKSRERVLTPTEIGNVVGAAKAMSYPFGPYFLMLALTGQRRVEVARAEWSEVDLTERRWTMPGSKAKNGKSHIVHLCPPLVEILQTMTNDITGTFLFTTTGTRPISGYSKAKRRLDMQSGVSDWTLHDLRRSFATHTTESLGISPVVIDKVLNHQSGAVRGVAAVYQRGQYLKERAGGLDAWGDWLMDHVSMKEHSR